MESFYTATKRRSRGNLWSIFAPALIPGVNNSGKFGRWAFVEFTEVFGMNADFAALIEGEFQKMVETVLPKEELT